MRYLVLILMIGLVLQTSDSRAQDRFPLRFQSEPVSIAALFQEPVPAKPSSPEAQTCTTPRSCIALGTVLTATGVGVTGLGVTFLMRLDAESRSDDVVVIPVTYLGGTLVVTGLLTTGVGIYLIARGRRLKRTALNVGWQGAPQAQLRVRF